MMRKITLLVLLCVGLHFAGHAQVRDSVKIYLPMFMDTTCPGTQLTFTAIQSEDTFSSVSYHWYTNGFPTGVLIDTFKTTALSDGDSVYCVIYFINSFGLLDSFRSNVIYIHHSTSIPPAVFISLISGSNPDCAGHPLMFQAFPKNGGTDPMYQWRVNGVDIIGADSATFGGIFGGTDTVSCQMISNSPCSAPYNDTVVSNIIPVIHIHLLAGISIVASKNPICEGEIDTFTATVTDPGAGSSIDWFVNGSLVSGTIGNIFITSTLHNGDLVEAVLNAPDSCELSHTVYSNIITMTVITNAITGINILMTHGANPGCIDSPVTFVGTYSNFGTGPNIDWILNGATVAVGTTTYTSTYKNGDVVTFRVNSTDGGCYTNDTLFSISNLMLRDSTPAAPLLSLIGNQLVNNMEGKYRWYFSKTYAYNGLQIGGASAKTYHPLSPMGGTGYYYTILDTGNCPSPPSNIIYISLLKIKSMMNSSDVNVYPNPTAGVLNLDWNNRKVNARIVVYNVIGQELMQNEVSNSSHHELDMASLADGNYLVVVKDNDDGSITTYKVYLQK